MFVGEIGVPILDVVGFVNKVMRKEGFSQSIGNEDAILNFTRFAENSYRLVMANEEVAEKVCYLNKMNYRDNLLRISLGRGNTWSSRPPRFLSWNEYYLTRYGVNDPIVAVQIFAHCEQRVEGPSLVAYLNQKLAEYELCHHDAIKGFREIASRSFILQMQSPQVADRICYLNNISVGSTVVHLQRPQDWSGPQAKYSGLLEFLRARSEEKRIRNQGNQTHDPPEEHEMIEILDDSDDDDVVVLYDNKEEIALQAEKDRLKAVLGTLTKSTQAKDQEAITLSAEVASLEKQLAVCDADVAVLQEESKNINDQVDTTNRNLLAVHTSWQEQVAELQEKSQQIEELKSQVRELRVHSRNVTSTLIEERDEKRLMQGILAEVQTRYNEAKRNIDSVKCQPDENCDL